MIPFLALVTFQQEPAVRTPSIYRCPTAEAESKFFDSMVEESGFDSFCVEPSPGPKARQLAAGKVKFVKASMIDTPANLKWRNATIDLVNGKLSPRAWLTATKNLHETVHFLSNPKTQALRAATGSVTRRAVSAELLTTALPGIPCFTADDIVQTRYLPGPGAYESWILAMNDYLGPMLYMREDFTPMKSATPTVVRADPTLGLLILRYSSPKEVMTVYFSNSPKPLPLPAFNLDQLTINVGIDMGVSKPMLTTNGFFITRELKGQKT